ncbi:MAG TPA: c-type cytochrome [Chromatiales bacterium]|nr:c-type cytochrome [Thiotrichales bacterium]HIP69515.1 c-type cytochrome [Chromatiales bacterium]
MKKQIILMAALALTLTACGQEAEKTVDAGKAAVEAGKAVVEKGKSVVESGEKAVEKVKEVVAPKTEAPVAEKTAGGVDGKTVYSACAGCHGADGKTKALSVSPIIAGQSKDDLVMKIKGYKDGSYGGAMKTTMAPLVTNLTDDQIAAVAEYISGL